MVPTEPAFSVWPTAQQTAPVQRTGRYVGLSTTHPAKMLPAIARQAIVAYSQPGDFVLDPMCGIGTTLVEAIHLGREAIGIEYEDQWARLAHANLGLARSQGATGEAEVITADARSLEAVVDPAVRGLVALVVTSPPYGASLHGQVRARAGNGVAKSHDRYSKDPANLAHQRLEDLLAGFTEILRGCAKVLRPGGVVAVTARPWRSRGQLVDLPGAVVACGQRAGLELAERNVALLAALRGDGLVGRVSFFQLERVRKARAGGLPVMAIAHEDLLVFRKAK